jgi:hypothetical protein
MVPSLFRSRTNHTCYQKPNPSRETVPFMNLMMYTTFASTVLRLRVPDSNSRLLNTASLSRYLGSWRSLGPLHAQRARAARHPGVPLLPCGAGQARSTCFPPHTLHIKGTVSRDFRLLVFFMNQFPPSPRVYH